MSVLLTVRHRIRAAEVVCDGCYTVGLCFWSEIEHPNGTEKTAPLCGECVGKEEVVILSKPEPAGVRAPSRAMKKTSQKRERALASRIGGRAQPASGATPHAKGDVRVRGEWRLDDKTTRTGTFALTRRVIDKIRSECTPGEQFAITIGFLDPMTQRSEDEVVVLDKNTWERMLNARTHK